MQIFRIYSGDDGESHFETLTADQLAELVPKIGDGPIRLQRGPGEFFSDYHIAPRRQYIVMLVGESEYETADGSVIRLGPGDVLVADDLTGRGHIARGVSPGITRVNIAVPLAPPSSSST